MKNVVSDVWQDLREKRLWPVALVLLLALVAVPIVLAKSGSGAGDAPPPVATPKAAPEEDEQLAKLATVELEESTPGEGSTLDTFDPSNPFRPPEKVVEAGKEEAAGVEAGPTEEIGVDVSGDQTDVTVDESSGDSAPPSSGGPTGGGDTPSKPVTTQYTYVIDVTFTANGRKRQLKGMERLDMLPGEANPLLLFLGAEADGANAVFLVDSTLQAAGEGKCEPSAKECGFLHIGAGSEHEFTNEEGDSYTLRIDEIRKVKVEAQGASKASRRKAGRGRRAGAAVRPRKRFVPLVIADLVTETTDDPDDSSRDGNGR